MNRAWRVVARARGCLRQYTGWLALLVAALFGLALATPVPVHAAETAQRQGEDLVFRNNTFKSHQVSNEELTARGLPTGVHLYEYTPASDRRQTIIFPNGTDPLRAKEATYVEYAFVEPNIYNKLGDASAITISGQQEAALQNNQNNDAQAGQNAQNNGNNQNGQVAGNDKNNNQGDNQPQDKSAEQTDKDDGATTSCSGTALGSIGWIVCPVSNFMAWITDQLYQQVAQYLAVSWHSNGSRSRVKTIGSSIGISRISVLVSALSIWATTNYSAMRFTAIRTYLFLCTAAITWQSI